MQQLAESQANPEVVVNRIGETLEHQSVYGKKQSTTTGLTWGYYGTGSSTGNSILWGGFTVTEGTLTLTGSATNYIVVRRSTGAITVSTSNTNWNNTTDYARVYLITTSSGAVSTVSDYRTGPFGVHGQSSSTGGGSPTLAGLSDVDIGSPGPADGDILVYDTGSGDWVAQAPTAVATDLDDLTDVTVSSPTTGDYLRYASGVFTNVKGSDLVRTVSGTTDTPTTADEGRVIRFTSSSAITVTIPPALSGTMFTIEWLAGAGTITLDATSTSNLNSLGAGVNIVLSQAAGAVTFIPTGTDTWDVIGSIGDLVLSDLTDVDIGSPSPVSGDVLTFIGGVWTAEAPSGSVADDSITNAKLANMATQTIKGRTTGGTGDPEDLTAAQAAAVVQGTGLDVDAAGFRGLPQNSQSGNYTTVAADAGKHIYHASGAGAGDTFTIDSNANVAYEIGTAITFVNMATDDLSIAITSDTLYLSDAGTTGTRTLAQYGIATALKLTSTTWLISGSGLT